MGYNKKVRVDFGNLKITREMMSLAMSFGAWKKQKFRGWVGNLLFLWIYKLQNNMLYLKCLYLSMLYTAITNMQIGTLIRSPEVKRSRNFDICENLLEVSH